MNTSIYFDQLISGTGFIFLFESMSLAWSSAFKAPTGSKVFKIVQCIWFKTFQTPHLTHLPSISLSFHTSILRRHLNCHIKQHKSDVVSLLPFLGGGARFWLFRSLISSLSALDLFKDLAAEFGELVVLAEIKFHCFHFLNPAAIKRRESESESCAPDVLCVFRSD